MDALGSLFGSTIRSDLAWTLVLFLFFLALFFLAYWAVKRGLPVALRPIASFDALKGVLAQTVEAGVPVHLSLGTAGIGDQHTIDTTAGLYVLEYIADRAVVSASPPIVTLANPTALPVAQDLLRRAYHRHGFPEEYSPARVRFIAPDPNLNTGFSPSPSVDNAAGQTDAFAYAAGTMRLLTEQGLIANVMVGAFGDEFLLLGETGAQQGLNQIGGTSIVGVLPFVYTSVANPLIGEEIFASGAYLSNRTSHISSLLTQDVMRWLVVGGILVGILLRTLGLT